MLRMVLLLRVMLGSIVCARAGACASIAILGVMRRRGCCSDPLENRHGHQGRRLEATPLPGMERSCGSSR